MPGTLGPRSAAGALAVGTQLVTPKEIIAVLSAAQRRLAVLASVLLVGLVAAGCGAVREQTQWQADRTHGVSATAGDIGIRNALVVADDEGRRATVIAMFDNARGEADELVSIRVGGRDAEPEGGPMEIPAGGNVSLGPDHTRLDVTGADAQPGRRVELEFIFANAPRATVNALVLSADGIYADALN
ncbi:MAG TPA: hypothetical protein VFZ63_03430 [Jiangellaceae bacterium]